MQSNNNPQDYGIISQEEIIRQEQEVIKKLFPEKLITTLNKTFPNGENNLKEYVSYLLSLHSYRHLKSQILLKAASIDPANEEMHYWIIRTAFENRNGANEIKIKFREFLSEILPCLSPGSLLSFYIQVFDDKNCEKSWEKLFQTWNVKDCNAITFLKQLLNDSDLYATKSKNELTTLFFTAGKCHEAKGEYQEALYMYESCVSNALVYMPDHPQTEKITASIPRMLAKIHNIEAASNSNQNSFHIQDPVKINAKGIECYVNKQYKNSIKFLEKAIAIYGNKKFVSKDCAECYSFLAIVLDDAGMLVDAYTKATISIGIAQQIYKENSPSLYKIELNRNTIYLKMAIQTYGRVSSEAAQAHIDVGHTYRSLGEKKEAIKSFEAARKILQTLAAKNGTKALIIVEEQERHSNRPR